jgi:hypothetical protein
MDYEEEIEIVGERNLEPSLELPFEEEEKEEEGEEYQVKHEVPDFGHEREKNEDSDDEEEEVEEKEEFDEEGNLITHPKHYESEEEEEEEEEKYERDDLEPIDEKSALKFCVQMIEHFMKGESQMTYDDEYVYRRYTIFHENKWQEMMNSNKIGLNTIYQTPFDINLLMYIYEMIYTKDYTMLDKLRHLICDEVIYYKKMDKKLKKKYSTIDYFEIYSKDDFENISPSDFIELIHDTEHFQEIDYCSFMKKNDKLYEVNFEDRTSSYEYSMQNIEEVEITSLMDLYNQCLDSLQKFEEN